MEREKVLEWFEFIRSSHRDFREGELKKAIGFLGEIVECLYVAAERNPQMPLPSSGENPAEIGSTVIPKGFVPLREFCGKFFFPISSLKALFNKRLPPPEVAIFLRAPKYKHWFVSPENLIKWGLKCTKNRGLVTFQRAKRLEELYKKG